MTGGTHISVAITASMLVMQPKTLPQCLCAIAGGVAGGLICDLDNVGKCKSLDHREDPFAWQLYVFAAIVAVILFGIDYFEGDGMIDYAIHHWNLWSVAGCIAFIGATVFGMGTPHRSFLHSVVAGAILTGATYTFCAPVTTAFGIGFGTHILIDELNITPVQYFWPLKRRKQLIWNRFPSNGKLNDSLGAIAKVAAIVICSYYLVFNFASSALYAKLSSVFSTNVVLLGHVNVHVFALYFIAINLVTLALYTFDYFSYVNCWHVYKCNEETADNMSGFIISFLWLFAAAGGFIGALLAVIMTQKGEFRKGGEAPNYNLYIVPLSVLVAWVAILLTFVVPTLGSSTSSFAEVAFNGIQIWTIIIVYLAVINIISAVFHAISQQYGYNLSRREKRNLILDLFGGAAGGYLAECITGRNKSSVIHDSLPFIITAYSVVLSCMLYTGIVVSCYA